MKLHKYNMQTQFSVGANSIVMIGPHGPEARALSIAYASATRCDTLLTDYFTKEGTLNINTVDFY